MRAFSRRTGAADRTVCAVCPASVCKTAQRLAFYVLSLPEEEAQSFAQAILDAKRTVVRLCPVCQNLTDQDTLCDLR